MSFKKLISNECLKYMSTLEGRKNAMTVFWGSNYNVPIYICDGICLLKIDDRYMINVYNVDKVFMKTIIFDNGTTLNIVKSERIIKNKIKKLKNVLENIEK